MDASKLLVAMTRHRLDAQAFVNREEMGDFKALTQRVGRDAFKETARDYHVSDAQKPYAQRVQHYRDLLLKGVSLRQQLENTLSDVPSFTKGLKPPAQETAVMSREALKSRFQETSRRRDGLAHGIAQDMTASQGFLEKLRIHEGKLLAHAASGELRETIASYHAAHEVKVKAEKARALLSLTENKHSPSLVRLLKEAGMSYERLRFDVLYAEKLQSQELSPQSAPDRIYGRIQAYQEAAREGMRDDAVRLRRDTAGSERETEARGRTS